jgi:predicted DNA-binding transcriptional regulator YafY
MKIFETYRDRLIEFDWKVRMENTGNAEAFAEQLHICRRSLYNLVGALQDCGVPVEYDSKRRTYYYTRDFSMIEWMKKISV